jgi:threonine dehydrogenase-like Zn-dependent dehydrogenase
MENAMQELVFVEKGKLEWRERAAPELDSPHAALVRPLAVSRCDLDLPIVTGRFPLEGPFGIGHEFVAEVLAVGDAVRNVARSSLVSVSFQICCGSCPRCLRGHTGSCSATPWRSAFGLGPVAGREFGGALADVVRVPFADAMLVALPPGIEPWQAAAISDNAVDGWRCVASPLAEQPGAPVLIVGGGAPSVGLYAVAAARTLGASDVLYLDASEERVAIAKQLGARVLHTAPRADLTLGNFPITVDASVDPAGLRLALASTDLEGTCTSASMYTQEVSLSLLPLYMRGVRFLTGRVNARSLQPEALARLADGSFAAARVVTRRVRWQDAAQAWAEPATKLVVER